MAYPECLTKSNSCKTSCEKSKVSAKNGCNDVMSINFSKAPWPLLKLIDINIIAATFLGCHLRFHIFPPRLLKDTPSSYSIVFFALVSLLFYILNIPKPLINWIWDPDTVTVVKFIRFTPRLVYMWTWLVNSSSASYMHICTKH